MNSINGKDRFSIDKLSEKEKDTYDAFFNKYDEEEREEKVLKKVTEIHLKNLIKERLYQKDKKRKRKFFFSLLIKIVSIIILLGMSWVVYNYYPSTHSNIPPSKDEQSIGEDTININDPKSPITPQNAPLINPGIVPPKKVKPSILIKTPNTQIYVLKRRPIKEEELFGGDDDVLNFIFNFDPARHLVNFTTLQDAFLGKDYHSVNTILAAEIAQNTSNQELKFFTIVHNLLSKQRIRPQKQIRELDQLKLSASFEADINWCYAYLYYLHEQRKSFEFLEKLNGTTYQEKSQELKHKLEEIFK